jgi:hypothetical protein
VRGANRGGELQDLAHELPRISLLKLSEKGCEQCPNREFSWYAEGKFGPMGASRQPVRLRYEHVRDFSDSFSETVWKLGMGPE